MNLRGGPTEQFNLLRLAHMSTDRASYVICDFSVNKTNACGRAFHLNIVPGMVGDGETERTL